MGTNLKIALEKAQLKDKKDEIIRLKSNNDPRKENENGF
jgi:hypothetical protein